MAITNNQARQLYLNNLKLPATGLKVNSYSLPTQADINPDTVEYFVDVDLDQLSVFFGDKSRPYSIDESDETYSLMIDDESDQVIGVSINHFLSNAIKKYPELIPVLRYATMIAGESLVEPDSNEDETRSSLRARIQEWINDRVRNEEKRAIFANFADLIGIH